MASRSKKAAQAVPFSTADLAKITKATPYIQRLIGDQELRDNLRTALDSSKRALDRLTSSKAPHQAVLEDKKLHKEVRKATEALRDASQALNDAAKPKKKKRRLGRKLLILVVGTGVALAASEGLRSKVLDTLFGAEEEFQYTPPAGAPTTPPASPVTAA